MPVDPHHEGHALDLEAEVRCHQRVHHAGDTNASASPSGSTNTASNPVCSTNREAI
jgi:hypothetical protein